MKVAITGANGFIGLKLAEYFIKNRYAVRTLARKKISVGPGAEHFEFELAKPVATEALRGVDVLIHCAHAHDASMISGTKALIAQARQARVRRFLFLSSMSAGKESLSAYGRAKFELEKSLDPSVDLIIRPGLVLGQGGLFSRIVSVIKKSPVIPLIGGGMQPIQTVHVDDLVRAVAELVGLNQVGIFQVASSPSITLSDLYLAIAERAGRKKLFLPIPLSLAEALISSFEFMRVPLPVNKENFLGLKQLGRLSPAPAAPLSFQLRGYLESLDDLFRTTMT